MKAFTRMVCSVAVVLILGGGAAQAGYVNHLFLPGQNLFANPLSSGANSIGGLIPTAPNGTTVSLWDALTSGYNLTSTYSGGAWSVNLTINPGTGALLTTTSPFTNTFVGDVVGLVLGPGDVPLPPAPLDLEPGTYLLGSVPPIGLSDGTYPAFLYVLGRAPRHGEAFSWLDELTQTWHTTTYNSVTGQWDNGSPTLGVSEAAFFTVVAVPEPSAFALVTLGAAVLLRFARRRA